MTVCLLVLRQMNLVEDAGLVPVPDKHAQDEAEAEAGEVEKQYIRRKRLFGAGSLQTPSVL